MARKLKVFRTPTGFHDAYVAAPSQKAALAAWGAEANLFSRGIAEQVTDPDLIKEPLARPGEVIMRSRGSLADQLQALGPRKSKSAKGGKAKPSPRKGKPPSRAKLDKAEAAVAEAARLQEAELEKLEVEQVKLKRRLEELKASHARKIASLEARRRDAEQDYREAIDAWSD